MTHPDKDGTSDLMTLLNLSKEWLSTAANLREALVTFINVEKSRRERETRKKAEEEQKAKALARLEEHKRALARLDELKRKKA